MKRPVPIRVRLRLYLSIMLQTACQRNGILVIPHAIIHNRTARFAPLRGEEHATCPMSKTIVALDLETTGLDPTRDAIIEVGAMKFKGERVEAEFTSLVNPGRKLPPFITRLTGIS